MKPRRISNALQVPEMDIWQLYTSPEDLQAALYDYPVRRFCLLACSPSTLSFVVKGTDPKEGSADFEMQGKMEECEGGTVEATIHRSFWAEDLAHTDKVVLVALVRKHYPLVGGALVRKSVAIALGAPILG